MDMYRVQYDVRLKFSLHTDYAGTYGGVILLGVPIEKALLIREGLGRG